MHVDVLYLAKILDRDIEHVLARDIHAGIGNRDVDAPEFLDHRRNARSHRGFITDTDLIRTNTDEVNKALIAMTPLRRIGKPADPADAVSLLASDDARWLTGQLIHVTGGIIRSRYVG